MAENITDSRIKSALHNIDAIRVTLLEVHAELPDMRERLNGTICQAKEFAQQVSFLKERLAEKDAELNKHNYSDEDYNRLHRAHCTTEAWRAEAVKKLEVAEARIKELEGNTDNANECSQQVRLLSALKPFAEAAKHIESDEPMTNTLHSSSARHRITLHNLSMAAYVYNRIKNPTELEASLDELENNLTVEPTSGFKQSRHMPSPTDAMIETPIFNAIYNEIKTWDVQVDGAYEGYTHTGGSHVQLIIDSMRLHGIHWYVNDDKRRKLEDQVIELMVPAFVNILEQRQGNQPKTEYKPSMEYVRSLLRQVVNLLDVHTSPNHLAPL